MRNRLVMKARRDRAEAITDRMFSVCERYRPAVQVAVLGPATKGGEMTLHLSLYAEHFSAIIAGTKRTEYRRRCARWDRMLTKPFRRVRFTNGYGAHRPWMVCEIQGIEQAGEEWRIHLGEVMESGNIHLLKASSSSAPSK